MKTIRALAPSIERGETSPMKLAEEVLQRAERLNPTVNAYITILRQEALAQAEAAEKSVREGRYLGPLHGIPVAIKDLIYIKGVRCTAGSQILATHVATYDAPVVDRLKQAGAVIIGTTNLHEFASGVTNVNPFFGAVRNPWDLGRVSGGSSGGSAAAVAAGMTVGAIGTDTSGSIRIPAGLCGVVGFKPTYGRISRVGVIPLSASFDTVGTLTGSVWDAAAMLQVLAGHEASDPTTDDVDVPDYLSEVGRPLSGIRVGVPRQYFLEQLDQGVGDLFNRFLSRLSEIAVTMNEVVFKGMDVVYETWAAVRRSEAAAFHDQWFRATPEKYGEDVRRALEKGREITAVQYINAQNARPSIKSGFLDVMRNVEFLAVPTTPITAPRIGEDQVELGGALRDVYSILSRLTLPFNVVGFPTISLPIGAINALPVGVQLVSRPFEEGALLRFAHQYEQKFGLLPEPSLKLA